MQRHQTTAYVPLQNDQVAIEPWVQKLSAIPNSTLQLSDATVPLSAQVKSLGVVLGPTLSMQPHIAFPNKACFFHLRCIASIRRYLTQDACIRLIVCLIFSRPCVTNSKMLIPKKNRVAIYEYLFKEGVLVAKKDFFSPKHQEIDVPNLHVIKALTSLKSKGFVREQFAWRNYYWYLTNEGIQYLRDFLHLPAEIVPATLKRQTRPEAQRPRPKGPSEGGPRGPAPDREYRKAGGPPGGDKKSDVGAGATESFQFRGGFGRGRPGGADRGGDRGGFGGAPSAQQE